MTPDASITFTTSATYCESSSPTPNGAIDTAISVFIRIKSLHAKVFAVNFQTLYFVPLCASASLANRWAVSQIITHSAPAFVHNFTVISTTGQPPASMKTCHSPIIFIRTHLSLMPSNSP